MSIINKIEHIFSVVFTTLAMTATLTGCVDDLIDESVEIPDAAVEIRGEVIYRPLVSTNIQTRATDAPEGAKYTNINSLYVFFFDKDKQLVGDYCGEVTFDNASKPENSDKRVTFNKRVKAGQYYVYAVVNVPKDGLAGVETIEQLRNFKLTWDGNIENDLEMFGVFKIDNKESPSTPKNDTFEEDALITITPQQKNLHSWVRRAVSKVTVDFNGDNLKEGVTVYIKNAVLKNLPSGAFLGADSRIDPETGTFKFAENTDYSITYGNGDSHEGWPKVTKNETFSPKEIWQDSGIESFHADNARALPCYENMQGTHVDKDKRQDKDGDGIIDSKVCDGVENGTYLEVEGYYKAERPEYKSQGRIIYRFMLGGNATDNFDLIRNHHYKITMKFKDYGNDVDWHIEYTEKYLDVTIPEDVNYQGRFFTPDQNYQADMANAGHTFSDQNTITVTSFETDGKENRWLDPEITYAYSKFENGEWVTDDKGNWLTPTIPDQPTADNTQKQYTFVASMTDPENITMNTLLSQQSAKGGPGSPYNLSNKNGGMDVENTANCYIVGAPGWYCFPLVYGNAYTNSYPNSAAYSSVNLVNHLKKQINNPYIIDNDGVKLDNVEVKLIWQDAQGLVVTNDLAYDKTLFGGKGGIKFHISTIQEGNAVIALIDKNLPEDEYVNIDRGVVYGTSGSTRAIWSWHIWVTRFGFEDFGKDIPIMNHDGKEFDVMPVNLGWCSGGKEFRYYKPRKCDITFTVGDQKITRTIEQYPHLLLPRGDHPYYQWGRKDPFVGSNAAWSNKKRWTHDGTEYGEGGDYNPPRLYNEPVQFSDNIYRKNAEDCLEVLVKNPDKWLNATRQPINPADTKQGFHSTNKSPSDLWSSNGSKTVYDPCPPGYQVSDNTVFTGFTTIGTEDKSPYNWYDVLESNMEQDYYSGSSINKQVLELYTDTRKLQSITFPVTGYRDYDGKAEVVNYPTESIMGEGYVWFNNAKDETNSYHLKFHRHDMDGSDWKHRGGESDNLIAPYEAFYNTDGFAVRPVSTSSMK